ncbi:GIY-YIG nuclease family protein [Flexivirga lutea]
MRCGDGSYYVGSTLDLERRLAQHSVGEGAAYTRRRLPIELVWAQESDSVRTAYELEKQVQNWSRAKREALITGRFDLLPELAKKRVWRRAPDG